MSGFDPQLDNAISSGNYKSALSLVSKKIQQYPSSSYFYAVQAQVLALSGQRHESINKATDLLNKSPTDVHTLKLLIEVFEICEFDPKEDIFEKVCKKYPTYSLTQEWFQHTIETYDIIGMQKATMMLTKSVSSSSSQQVIRVSKMIKLWASVTLMLACDCCKTQLNPSLLKLYPQLGLKMIEQVKPSTAPEFYVYAKLLESSNKNDEVLKQLGDFLSKENDLELKILYLNNLERLEKFDELFKVTKRYLVELNEDDWDTWKLFIKAGSHVNQLPECVITIQNYSITRNSQLAHLELCKHFPTMNRNEYLTNYFEKYGHKLCLFQDLSIFVKPETTNFLPILESEFNKRNIVDVINKKRKPTDNDAIFMVNYLKFLAYLNPSLFKSPEFIDKCCIFYGSIKPLLNKLVEFEYFPGFEMIILIIESMISQADSLNEELLIKLIIILENSLEKNQHEFHLKLWLISLYSKLNILSKSDELFDSLKIKFIQLDTLSHILNNRLSTVTFKKSKLHDVDTLYSRYAQNELPHMINNCFQKLALNKLQGFIEFQIRLESSFTRISNSLELITSSRLANDQHSIDNDLKPLLKKFYTLFQNDSEDINLKINDNRDLKTFWDCGIHSKIDDVDEKLNSINGAQSLNYLKLIILKELIIYDSDSVHFGNYVIQFRELFQKSAGELTKMEFWNLSIVDQLVSNDKTKIKIPSKPTNTFNFEFNHYYFTLTSTVKQLQYVISKYTAAKNKKKNSGSKWDEAQIKKLKIMSAEINNVLKTFRNDESLELNKVSSTLANNYKANIKDYFNNDPTGRLFDISGKYVDSLIDGIKDGNIKSISELRKI